MKALGSLGLLYFSERSQDKSTSYENELSSADLILLDKAVELGKYAIASYTGRLLDVPRYSMCCCCCLRPNKCLKDRHNIRYSSYVGEPLHFGKAGRTSCQVSYFIVRKDTEIIISVRGTENVRDAITDCLLLPVPLAASDLGSHNSTELNCGMVHCGVLAATSSLCDELYEKLSNIVLEYEKGVTIWLVGHSLGASCAQLASYSLNKGILKSRGSKIRAIGFQPMPFLDAVAVNKMNEAYPGTVISIPFGDDIVSRFSLRALWKLQAKGLENPSSCSLFYSCRLVGSLALRCICKSGDQTKQTEQLKLGVKRAKHVIRNRNGRPVSTHHSPSSLPIQEESDIPALYIAGIVFLTGRLGDTDYLVTKVSHLDQNIILPCNMLVDHVPWRLLYGLSTALGYRFSSSEILAEAELSMV